MGDLLEAMFSDGNVNLTRRSSQHESSGEEWMTTLALAMASRAISTRPDCRVGQVCHSTAVAKRGLPPLRDPRPAPHTLTTRIQSFLWQGAPLDGIQAHTHARNPSAGTALHEQTRLYRGADIQ
jgi:hypothetical protein